MLRCVKSNFVQEVVQENMKRANPALVLVLPAQAPQRARSLLLPPPK
jgi:hypothetical protein